MKTLILTLTTTLALNANASWMQQHCSNGEATTRTSMGHNENFVQWTEQSYDAGGVLKTRVVVDEDGKIDQEILAQTEIEKDYKRSCVPGKKEGWVMGREVSYVKVKLTNGDGSKFPKGAVGVSEDGLSLTANLICEQVVTSMVICPK